MADSRCPLAGISNAGASPRQCRMRDRQERRAGGIDPQRARPEADGLEAVILEKRQLEGVPPALGPDRDEHAFRDTLAD